MYWGAAAGKAKQAATTEIEKIGMKNMTCEELVKQAAKIIYTVHDEVKVIKPKYMSRKGELGGVLVSW